MIERKWFKNYPKAKKFVYDLIDVNLEPFENANDEGSALDDFVLPLIRAVVDNGSFVDVKLSHLENTLLQVHKEQHIIDIVIMRWKAVSSFFEGNRESCVESLQEAYELSIKYDAPEWLKTDILIDIRNQAGALIYDSDVGRNAQSMIEASAMEVNFPLLDRFTASTYAKLVSQYEKSETTLPHTTTLIDGEISEMLKHIYSAFLVAAFYGSITHIERINIHLKKLLFIINLKYVNSKYFKKYIRTCLLGWEGKEDENSLSNTFQSRFSLLTQDDAKEIWEIANRTSFTHQKINRKLIAMRYIGNLLDSDTFNRAATDCLNLVSHNDMLRLSSGHVSKFLKKNAHRMDSNIVIDFLFNKLNYSDGYICTVLLNSICNVDYSLITDNSFECIKKFVFKDEIDGHDVQALLIFMVVVRKGIQSKYHEEFDKLVKTRYPNDFVDKYLFEVCPNDKLCNDFIMNELAIAKKENEVQGNQGLIRYGRTPLTTVRNVLTTSEFELDFSTIQEIVLIANATLEHRFQTLDAKISATELLVLLMQKHRSIFMEQWANECYEKRYSIDVDADPFENKSRALLDAHFVMLGILLGKNNEKQLMLLLATVNGMSYSVKIDFMAMVHRFSSRLSSSNIQESVLNLLFQFSLTNTFDKVNAIRYYAVRALTSLVQLLSEYTNEVLRCFSESFDVETTSNKSYIMDGAMKISKDSQHTLDILNKARLDSNFHIRKLSYELQKED